MTELYKMLGIDLKGDQADAYRIFGLTPLETDTQLIRYAIDQTRKKLEPHEGGPSAADCSRIQAYLGRSEAILTDPARKRAFDDVIRVKLREAAVGQKGVTGSSVSKEAGTDTPQGPAGRNPPLPRRSAGPGTAWGRRIKAVLAVALPAAALALLGRQFAGPERFPKSRVTGDGVAARPQALAPITSLTEPSIPDLPLGVPKVVPGFEGITPVYSPALSPDMNTIVFSTTITRAGSYDLAVADRVGVRNPFSRHRPVSGCGSEGDETCPGLSPDLLELVFVRSDQGLKPATRLFYARRDSVRQAFQGAEPVTITGLGRRRVRLDTPQWADKGRALLYMLVDLEAGGRGERPYFLSRRNGRTGRVGEPAPLPLSNPWPLTFLSSSGLRAYHVTDRGIRVSSRGATTAPFGPIVPDPLLTTEHIGPLDGPVWVAPNEDVLFYCSPGVGKELGHGRFLWMVRFR